MIVLHSKLNTTNHKIDILSRYVNTFTRVSKSDNMTASTEPSKKKNDKPEKGIKKFAIYHMKGCIHCHNFMNKKQKNGMSKCEELRNIYKNDKSVEILDFQYGLDEEAQNFNAFPAFRIITETENIEYNNKRDISSITEAINNTN